MPVNSDALIVGHFNERLLFVMVTLRVSKLNFEYFISRHNFDVHCCDNDTSHETLTNFREAPSN